MRIAVIGCTHGQLDQIYEAVAARTQQDGVETDLIICCGDFEACRNTSDLSTMSSPAKYHHLKDFYKVDK